MSGNYGQNNRTLNVDTLFVRDIYFRDFANNPIPANQPFVSRGDGGTYFTSSFASTIALPAINAITASTVTGPYQFAPIGVFNTFNLTAAASMQFYSNADNGGLIIYNTGPEQIIADGQVLPFTDLPDYTVGGRTLQYVGTGDTYLQVSDATIFFNSVYNSSISTVLFLQSTTIGLEYELNSSLSILNSLITSTGLYNYNLISSYFLTPNVINISTVSTSLLVLGDNYIQDTPLRDSVYDPCIVYTGSTILSTNTDFLTFTDNFSGVTFAIDKEYLFGSSTLLYGPSTTTVTRGQQVQLGWFPTLSTQTNTQSLRAQFVPVVQQIQVLEQLVSTSGFSTTTNYYMKNIGRFDEICNPNKISLIAPVIAATLRKDNTVNNSWIQYDTATSSIVWGNNGGSGSLQSGSNYGDYTFWNGSAWTTGFSTISIGDQAGGGFATAEGQGEAAIAIGAAAGYSTQGAYAVAMGYTAGQYGQGETAVAIGNAAGNSNQGSNTVAIGNYAGGTVQGDLGIAIGDYAGYSNQQNAGIAIGRYAGQYNQQLNAVAIGNEAGNSNQRESAVAIGDNAGLSQSSFGIAIGLYAGCTQDQNAIAIGSYAGYNTQNENTVAIGNYAGGDLQDVESVAIGDYAGVVQSSFAVAIGYYAGNNNQNQGAIAIGSNAGSNNQGRFAVAIGAGAGRDGQSTCTIVLNATGQNLNTVQASSFYVAPIRQDSVVSTSFLQYNTVTKEIVWNNGGGNVIGSTMTQSLIPDIDNVYDIGTSTLRLRHLYVGPSSLTIGTGSISADNGGNLYATNAAGNTITIGSGTLATDNFCVALGYGPNYIAYSYDGINWTGTQTQVFPNGIGICAAWNGSLWLAGGTDDIGDGNTLACSSDGIHWTSLSGESPFNTECTCIAWNGSIWVAGGQTTNTLAYSRDGLHWTGLGTSVLDTACNSTAWNGTICVAVGQTTVGSPIQYSYDGITWTSSAYSQDPNLILECVAWNGSMWVAGGYFPVGLGNISVMLYSYDGVNWNSATTPFNYNTYSVAWNGFMWVAGGNQGTAAPFFVTAYSYNGIDWTLGDLGIDSVKSVTWNGSIWIAGGGTTASILALAYSYNGINWMLINNTVFPAGTNVQGVVSRNILPYVGMSPVAAVVKNVTENFCVALCDGYNKLAYSYDGLNWNGLGTGPFSVTGNGICAAWNGTVWIVGGYDDGSSYHTMGISSDGINWTSLSGESPFQDRCNTVVWNGSIWVAGGVGVNTLAFSLDGRNWTGLGTSIFDTSCRTLAWNGTLFVAGGGAAAPGSANTLAYSIDGVNWQGGGNSVFTTFCNSIAWNGSIWVGVGYGTNKLGYSYDGINWTGLAGTVFNTIGYAVAWNGSIWLAGGSDNGDSKIASSYDGITWSTAATGLPIYSVLTLAWNGSVWIAGGVIASGTNSLFYSSDGTNWTGAGSNLFTGANGVASRNVLPYVGSSPIPFTRMSTIAYGTGAGSIGQGLNAVAIGYYAGLSTQGVYSIAVGAGAGLTCQGSNAVAVGVTAGTNFQSTNAVAIGAAAGQDYQGPDSVAVGTAAGLTYQGSNAVAIGAFAGQINQGSNAIAIGFGAGVNNQSNASIVINATGQTLNTVQLSSFYVAPIRNSTGNTNALTYDIATGEIIYDTTKTFVINHPKDESKYLVHACLEGPEAGVYYRGTGTIADLESSVIVELPDYVDALAVDLTVQVTPIYNGSVRVLNASCVSNNKFTVYGDSGDFHWHVYGRRAAVVVEPKKSDVAVLGEGPYRWIA